MAAPDRSPFRNSPGRRSARSPGSTYLPAMIGVLLVDDETGAREFLRERLASVAPEVRVLAEAGSGPAALPLIEKHRPALVFLDVEMPGGDGFDLLKTLGTWDFDVIFTTGFQRYAIQAIRFSALDYLLKPVQADELRAAIDRHLERHPDPELDEQHQAAVLANLNEPHEQGMKLTLRHGNGLHFVAPSDVAFCRAEDNYTELHLCDGRRFMVARTLKEYEDMLTELGFIRVHRSYLVNREAIERITTDGFLEVRGGHRVEISRRRKEEVLKLLRA